MGGLGPSILRFGGTSADRTAFMPDLSYQERIKAAGVDLYAYTCKTFTYCLKSQF